MASYNKFNSFTDYLCKGGCNLGSDQIKVMLSNTMPVATNAKYSDVSGGEVANGNGYTTGGAVVPGTALSNVAGTENFAAGSNNFTASGGNMGPFRYVIYYDNTNADKALICWFDYGSSVTLNGAAGESFVLNPATALFTLG